MAEWEDKMNQILSSPEAMEQIMSLANSLSQTGTDAPAAPAEESATQPAGVLNGLSGLADPAMLSRLMPLLSLYREGEDDRTRLLQSMKPFLRQERQHKLEQAMRIARLSKVIRAAMGMLREGGDV